MTKIKCLMAQNIAREKCAILNGGGGEITDGFSEEVTKGKA